MAIIHTLPELHVREIGSNSPTKPHRDGQRACIAKGPTVVQDDTIRAIRADSRALNLDALCARYPTLRRAYIRDVINWTIRVHVR